MEEDEYIKDLFAETENNLLYAPFTHINIYKGIFKTWREIARHDDGDVKVFHAKAINFSYNPFLTKKILYSIHITYTVWLTYRKSGKWWKQKIQFLFSRIRWTSDISKKNSVDMEIHLRFKFFGIKAFQTFVWDISRLYFPISIGSNLKRIVGLEVYWRKRLS